MQGKYRRFKEEAAKGDRSLGRDNCAAKTKSHKINKHAQDCANRLDSAQIYKREIAALDKTQNWLTNIKCIR